MAGEWQEITLGGFAPFSYGKGLPKSRRKANGSVPVYGSNGLVGFHDIPLTSGPTIIIGRKGTVGAVHYSPVPCWPIDTTFFISGSDPLLVRYRYYMLKSLGLEQMNADSAVPGLNRDAAHARRVRVPMSEDEQRTIAHILGTLDDKIELNRRMNETLEQIAQVIFKSWFVDFESAQAKMDGRWRRGQTLPGLPAHLYDLFPDRLVDSELGEIPEGWKVGNLGDILTQLISGNRPKGGAVHEGVPSIGAENVIGLGKYDFSKEKYIPRNFFEELKCKGADLRSRDVLLYKDGAQIGRKTYFEGGFPHAECAVNEHVFILRANRVEMQRYLFFWLDQDWMTQKIVSLNSNSAQPGINQSGVRSLKILIPPDRIIDAFDRFAGSAVNHIFILATQSRTLAALRDALLPKLISGELRVKDAERILARCV